MNTERVLTYFSELSCIPRLSGEEGQIADYLEARGRKMNLEVHRDAANNVILKKKGSRDNGPCVVLQSHSDMVFETTDDEWKGERVPKGIHIDNGKMKACGTTLGADNGIGMALMLALLEEEEAGFPKIEALFSANEEETMGGAYALKEDDLIGSCLINLDSEEEGVFTIGAAGGISVACTVPAKRRKTHFLNGLSIRVTGGLGGHSGLEIHRKRENAIQLLVRILQSLPKEDFELSFLQGGTRSNAIPECAEAKINTEQVNELQQKVKDFYEFCRCEWSDEEINLTIEAEVIPANERVYEEPERLLVFLESLPHGVYSRTHETIFSSINLALLKEVEDEIFVELTLRSSYKSWYRDEAKRIGRLATSFGGHSEERDEYPAWMCQKNSELLNCFQKSYRELFRRDAISENIHAGVECGIIMENCPSIADAISIGPTIHGAHTVNEELDIESVYRVYLLLKNVLRKLNREGDLSNEK